MISGLYTSASGMVAIEAAQSAAANNIANVSTNGFRRHQAVQMGFYEVFSDTLREPFSLDLERAPGGGTKLVETYTDTASGVLLETGDPLNVGVEGPGFFTIDTPRGERFTRDGSFKIDIDGDLATAEGYKVQSAEGQPIDVRGGQVLIHQDGRVQVDGVHAGTIQMTEFQNAQELQREGENLYAAREGTGVPAENTTAHQGRLEAANVNLPLELTNMLLGLRAYEANQRAIRAADDTMNSVIQRVGMPA